METKVLKVFLLSVCLGTANTPAAEMITDQPLQIVSQLVSAGQTVYHVTIKSI